jgi:hypothetical protein
MAVYFWTRYRWAIGSVVIEMALLGVLATVLRQLGVEIRVSEEAARAYGFRSADAVHAMLQLCAVVVTFVFLAPLWMLNREPTRTVYLLPVRSHALAWWCLSVTAAGTALGWIGFACVAWRPMGFPLPVLWPAMLAAAASALTQAIAWIPSRRSHGESASPFGVIPLALLCAGLGAAYSGIDPNIIAIFAACATAGAAAIGLWSMERARAARTTSSHHRQSANAAPTAPGRSRVVPFKAGFRPRRG